MVRMKIGQKSQRKKQAWNEKGREKEAECTIDREKNNEKVDRKGGSEDEERRRQVKGWIQRVKEGNDRWQNQDRRE